jgi:ATP-dependent protease HslVU (ClpYQ) ATPase subunit
MVGFLLSTGVSLMMNGVCCVYQMHGEKELRQAMRSDIREEWKEQREIEAKTRQHYEVDVERLRRASLEQRYQLMQATRDVHGQRNGEASLNVQDASQWSNQPDITTSLTKILGAKRSLFDEDEEEGNPQDGSM